MRLFLILALFIYGCNSSSKPRNALTSAKEIDYTFDNGWKEAYSIKINSTGRCIVGDGRWDIKYYEGQLSEIDIRSLDSLIQNTSLKQFDSTYNEDIPDQSSYKIVLVESGKDTITRFVYGRKAPKMLNDFSNYLRKTKERLSTSSSDTVVNFISRKNFYPPAIPK